jgi:hypothetical protein
VFLFSKGGEHKECLTTLGRELSRILLDDEQELRRVAPLMRGTDPTVPLLLETQCSVPSSADPDVGLHQRIDPFGQLEQ